MTQDEKPKLALRVFKRTTKYLILLWRRKDGVDPTAAELSFRELKNDASKTPTVKVKTEFVQIDEPIEAATGAEVDISHETVICLIREKDAGLDPASVYYVKVKYGEDEEGIRVTPAGVYPSHEREDRNKNVHLMGWDDEGQCWRKVSVVKGPKGQWFLGVASPEEQFNP